MSRVIGRSLFAFLAFAVCAAGLSESFCGTAKAEGEAGEAYRSRYMSVGFLTRASIVCANNKKAMKRFLSAAIGILHTPELKMFSKGYPETMSRWTKEGAEAFNSKVMTDGVRSACASAIAEINKTEGAVIEEPTGQSSSNDDPWDTANLVYTVSFTGTCKYKLLNRDAFLPCDSNVKFQNFKDHRSAFTFTAGKSAIYNFSGGRDRQPDLENYYLTIDKLKMAVDDDGAQGKAEGECYMHVNADASKYYEIKCDVFDRKSGLVFNFYLTDISGFEKKGP